MSFTVKVGIEEGQEENGKSEVFYQVEKIILPNGKKLTKPKGKEDFDFSPLKEFVNENFTLEYTDGKKETCVLLNVGELEGVQCIYFENVEQYKLSIF